MCVKLRLRVQMYIVQYNHLCNVSRFLTIVYKERIIHDVCRIVKYTMYGIENLFRCVLEICVTLPITYACLLGMHDVCGCRPHCLIYKLVTVTHINVWTKNLQAIGMN